MVDRSDLTWRGDEIWSRGLVVGGIVQDVTHQAMWRVRRPDGSLSDMVNRARAMDAAETTALAVMNRVGLRAAVAGELEGGVG